MYVPANYGRLSYSHYTAILPLNPYLVIYTMTEILSHSSTEKIEPLWEGLELFEHQKVGIKWGLEREREGFLCPKYGSGRFQTEVHGGELADEMGAGKTIQMLAIMATNPVDSTLIVVPKAVVKNWTDNAVRAGFRVFIMTGTGATAKWSQVYPAKAVRASAVYICSYASLIHRPRLTKSSPSSSSSSNSSSSSDHIPWGRVVFDEAHVFRNPATKLYKEVMKVVEGVKYRWIVTATPIVNKPRDAVSLLAVIGVPASKGREWVETYYRPLLPTLVLHRSMEKLRSAVADMPAKPIIHDVVLPFVNDHEYEFYLMLQKLNKRMLKCLKSRDATERAEGLVLLLRLRQAGLTPELVPDYLVDKTNVGAWPAGMPSSKMLEIRRLVQAEPTKKFLVFCWFHKEMALIEAMLEEAGITVEQYHGGMSETHRNDVLDRARKPACQVLLIQIRSGGVGLNLQEFNRVVFTSPYWTSAMMDQAIGRAVRIGQKDVVQVYHLLMDTDMGRNIDTFTADIAEAKRAMGEAYFAAADGDDLDSEDEGEEEGEGEEEDTGPTPETFLSYREAREALGVTATSDKEEVRSAYLAKVLEWHPDKNPERVVEATSMFQTIRKAYEMLKDLS